MKELENISRLFGLIGYPLSHSFSKRYFTGKFEKEGITACHYELFPLESITEFPALLKQYPNLQGLNVTIPYKQQVIPYLDSLDEGAAAVGAVNTIKLSGGRLRGYNTDVYGFERSLRRFLHEQDVREEPLKALLLGTGGAARACAFVLNKMEIPHQLVSRTRSPGRLTYRELDETIMSNNRLIINTTPLGMSPHTETLPELPYRLLGSKHLLFDLVYNPEETLFMKKGRQQGAAAKNGLEMLHEQAEKAWDIWN